MASLTRSRFLPYFNRAVSSVINTKYGDTVLDRDNDTVTLEDFTDMLRDIFMGRSRHILLIGLSKALLSRVIAQFQVCPDSKTRNQVNSGPFSGGPWKSISRNVLKDFAEWRWK